MAFKYNAKTLDADGEIIITGGCLSIHVEASDQDSVFNVNAGDPIRLRAGKSITFNHTAQLDKAVVKCESGQIDVMIEYATDG